MGRHYQILIPLLSLFLVRVDLTDLIPLSIPVKLKKIYDGDTVLLKKGSYEFKVRLSKIDAPEKKQPFINSNRDAGEASTLCLKNLFKTTYSPLTLHIFGWDMYGRVLGDINRITLKSIESGCATLYPHAEFKSIHEKFTYLRALKKAKASRRGLWQYGGFIQPKIWRKLSKRNAVRR